MHTPTTGKIRPNSIDFSHRIFDIGGNADIACSIEEIAGRAEAVIGTVQALCITGEDENGLGKINRINPETVYFALDSALKDLRDIKAIVLAWADATDTVGGAA